MNTINMQLIKRYTDELRQKNPLDEYIREDNVLEVFLKIGRNAPLKQIFYSKLMFYTIFLILRRLFLDKLIRFNYDRGNEEITVSFTTDNIMLDGRGFNFPHLVDTNFDDKNIHNAKEIIEMRTFNPSLQYFQSYDTFDSLKRRFKIMAHFDDISNKSIIFLGDDELFSIFYALNSKAARIAVVDVDERITNYIQCVNKKYQLNIETYTCDLLHSFPDDLHSSFDVFFASGLKDLGGLMVFICTGLNALRDENGVGYFTFYNYDEAELNGNKNFEYKLQKYLLDMNCYLECIVPCDEIEIDDKTLNRTVELITWARERGLHEDYLTMVKTELRKNNVLAAAPSFPYFPIKPAKLARIRSNGLTAKPRKMLEVLKKFSRTKYLN